MNINEFISKFNIRLNNQQLEAVQAVNGPTLLLAVPGSGKTTVLVTRLGYMLYCLGIDPARILTLTYTRAATKDMAERFESMFGCDFSGRVEFRTINGICDKIIKYFAAIDGREPFQLESNEKKLNQILSALYQQVEMAFPTENDIKILHTLITYAKNMRLSAEEIEELGEENDISLGKIYKGYQAAMRQRGLMDYDDQMVYAYNILRRSPETLRYFQNRYQYICVDEAQDTSKIQHEIIALLAKDNENIFMVGDEDQSIYGFRAAYPKALLQFEHDHPGARVLLMEENFRSCRTIVEAADMFIRHNVMRHDKHMISRKPEGMAIKKLEIKGRKAQYTYLCKVAESLTDEAKSTAVLFRNNESAIPLIDLMERSGLPYRMRGRDLMFFTHRSVMDVRAIIDFARDMYNTELFMQIYYKMSLYINKKEAQKACSESVRRGITVLDALERYCGLNRYRQIKIKSARTNLERLPDEAADKGMIRILRALEYGDYLERSGMSEDRIDILRIVGANGITTAELGERLDYLKAIICDKSDDENCPFILSTIHSSKGLEYDNVFLIDCADGIFPSNKREEAEDAEYEEERRLFYVAITRAKESLTLFSQPQGSEFLYELFGEEKKNNISSSKGAAKTSAESIHFTSLSKAAGNAGSKTVTPTKKKKFQAAEFRKFTDQLGQGIGVKHAKFGTGVINYIDEHSVTIEFDDFSEKTFNLRILYENGLLTVQ